MGVEHLTREQREALAALIKTHRVLYEVYPQRSYVTGQEVSIGYDVELLGVHAAGAHDLRPGCAHCLAVWDDLRRIGEAIIPSEAAHAIHYEVQPFDAAIHFGTGNHARDNVRLVVAIRHEEDYLAPIDPGEERGMRKMIADLRALGARDRE